MRTYEGGCHCGALKLRLTCEEITSGLRCNCSICRRKGAVMSTMYFGPEQLQIVGLDALAVYRWGDRMVNNYFCKTCGIYTFHDTTEKPGHYRLNLGCLEGVDPLGVSIKLVDGASF